MRSQGDNGAKATAGFGGSAECKPLLSIATGNIFRHNAFRITGLPVDASAREVTKHIDKLKQMAELGIASGAHRGPFALNPPPTADDIREAHQNLKDPERRILDEFFWFWPEEFGCSRSDPAIQAIAAGDFETAMIIWSTKETNPSDGVVAMHNMAVFWQMKALDAETGPEFNPLAGGSPEHVCKFWRDAIKRWAYLSSDDVLWEKVAGRVRQAAEARLTTGFVRRMRSTLPIALRKVHAELALHYSQSGAEDFSKLHIRFMRDMDNDVDASNRTIELILGPTTARVREHIRNAKQAADSSSITAHLAARDLIDLSLPLRNTFDLFYGAAPHEAKDLFDEVANVCTNCLVAYQRSTGDNRTFFELLQRALPLASTSEVRIRLQKNIKIGKENWAFGALKSIQDSKDSPRQKLHRFRAEAVPAVGDIAHISGISASFGPLSADSDTPLELLDNAAIVLRNISLDAWNNHRDQTTAIDANELALQYATNPELRKRLTDDRLTMGHSGPSPARETRTHYTPPPPARPAHHESNFEILKQNKGFVVAAAIVLMVIVVSIKSCDSPSSSVTSTPSTSASQSSYTPPAAQSQPASVPQNPFSQFDSPQPQFTARPRPSSGQPTYRVSPAISAELDRDKQAIDAEKGKAARIEAQLEESAKAVEAQRTVTDELDANLDMLSRQIDRERLYLDRTSQYDIDSFNLKINRYNAALQNRKAEVAAFNALVDSHNTLVQQLKNQNRLVNQMVDNYNAKLQQHGR